MNYIYMYIHVCVCLYISCYERLTIFISPIISNSYISFLL